MATPAAGRRTAPAGHRTRPADRRHPNAVALGLILRHARESCGLSQSQAVVTALGRRIATENYLGTIENGHRFPSPLLVEALASRYGIAGQTLAALGALLPGGGATSWDEQGEGGQDAATLSPRFVLEAIAPSVRHAQGYMMPGLLQTPEYTRAIVQSATREHMDGIIEARRLRRDRVLVRSSPAGPRRIECLLSVDAWERPPTDDDVGRRCLDLQQQTVLGWVDEGLLEVRVVRDRGVYDLFSAGQVSMLGIGKGGQPPYFLVTDRMNGSYIGSDGPELEFFERAWTFAHDRSTDVREIADVPPRKDGAP